MLSFQWKKIFFNAKNINWIQVLIKIDLLFKENLQKLWWEKNPRVVYLGQCIYLSSIQALLLVCKAHLVSPILAFFSFFFSLCMCGCGTGRFYSMSLPDSAVRLFPPLL